jgi:hypothetical protein
MRIALLATVLAATTAQAQSWQTITQARRVSGEEQLRVFVEHGAGTLRIHPAGSGQLYRVALRYDEDIFTPRVRYTLTSSSLRVTMQSADRRGNRRDFDWDDDAQSLDLQLTPDVPLALSVRFGAGRADVDLGGLNIRTLSVETGASQSQLRFDTPNAGSCRFMELKVGAAEFRAFGLGNARCDRITLDAGVGDILLDLSGDLPEGFAGTVSVHMGLGGLEVRVPEDLGVRLNVRRFLASVERVGFIAEGNGSWVTPNWNEATRKITLDIRAVFGRIEIVRVGS